MKKYLVTLIPANKIPEDGCESALADIHLWVLAEDREEAGEKAVKIMEAHQLYCKVYLARCGSPSDSKHLVDFISNKYAEKERRMKK